VSKLTEFSVEDLFGLYSHRIPIRTEKRITAIIAPNGRGKTVCLKLIEALFTRQFSYLSQTLFRRAVFSFSGGEKITIQRQPATSASRSEDSGPEEIPGILIEFSAPGEAAVAWNPVTTDQVIERLRRSGRLPPFISQTAPDLFVDETDGEVMPYAELIRRFGGRTIESATASEPKESEAFKSLISSIKCHLIETQRLLVLPGESGPERWSRNYDARSRGRFQSKLVVQQKAEKLRSIIQSALTQYAALSQSLDRSFPKRVIEAPGDDTSESNLKKKLEDLDTKRRELMGAGILETESDYVSVGPGQIEEAVAKVLSIYVKDNEEKLTVFNSLLAKIELFRDLVNARFIDKLIETDRKSGFRITAKNGRDVPLDRLSSGEQHQLEGVMYFSADILQ
jgi:hypothetical protein